MSIFERAHRLDPNLYKGTVTCSFTCCVADKALLFISPSIVSQFEKILLDSLTKHQAKAHVYLFMPDHLHILIEGKTSEANVLTAIKIFKQKTGYLLSQNRSSFRWQKDFYDHILHNPVRAGLVKNWHDYPYKGSTLYDLDDPDFL